MEISNRQTQKDSGWRGRFSRILRGGLYYLVIVLCSISMLHSSLLVTSMPLQAEQIAKVDAAINLMESKGFRREAFILRNVVVFRGTDNWLNAVTNKDNAFAATNFPLNIVTLYPDFFYKAKDDTERAMILLHEVRHVQGGSEHDAYSFAWNARRQMGWTVLSHGTTDSYVTIEAFTREIAPELFTCADRLWNDCTEIRPAKPVNFVRAQ